jgi:hypothetical protein
MMNPRLKTENERFERYPSHLGEDVGSWPWDVEATNLGIK